jgi:outer membrane protein assembly factor BamE (lipoprotein component of BamABCDE complex)
MRNLKIHALYGVAATVAVVVLAGCVSGTSEYKESGTYVSPATLRQIEPGTTSGEWVHGVLGEPTERISVGKNEEIWKYHYAETRNRRGQILFVIGADTHEASSSVFFEIKNGKVTRKWQG